MRSRTVSLLLRIFVSAALLAYIVFKVDWSRVRVLVYQTDFFYLFLSFAISGVLISTSVWKWALLLRAKRQLVPTRKLFQLYLVGYFFNNVLPSNVGGDLIRAYEVGKALDDHPAAMASVFVERFTGLTALMLLACLSFLSNLQIFVDLRFAAVLGAAVLGFVVLLLFVLTEAPLRYMESRFHGTFVARPLPNVMKLQRAIRSYSEHRRVLYAAMGISFLFYLFAVVNVYFSSLAFGTLVPFEMLVVIVPVVLVISMIPISLGGIGLQEWAYVFCFTAIGADGSLGLLVGLLMRVKGLAYGLLGGVLYARAGLPERSSG